MQIDKQQIIELLRQRGDEGTATQADSQLPDQVDTDRDKGLLDKLGIDVGDVLKLLGGGKGGGGGLGGLLG